MRKDIPMCTAFDMAFNTYRETSLIVLAHSFLSSWSYTHGWWHVLQTYVACTVHDMLVQVCGDTGSSVQIVWLPQGTGGVMGDKQLSRKLQQSVTTSKVLGWLDIKFAYTKGTCCQQPWMERRDLFKKRRGRRREAERATVTFQYLTQIYLFLRSVWSSFYLWASKLQKL